MPTLSNLIVTNRLPFIDWWTWNITKQSRRPDEVVLATNYPFELEEDAEAFEYTVRAKLLGIPLHTVFMDSTKTVGELRQAALDAAVGDFITWSDDDDWYHPGKLSWLLEQGERGAPIAVFPLTHRLFLSTGQLYRWPVWHGLHLPGTLYRTEYARTLHFPAKMIGEDSDWIQQVVESNNVTAQDTPVNTSWLPPLIGGIILVHGNNVYQTPSRLEQDYEGDGETLEIYPPPGIARAEWATLHLQLHALKQRLSD
jgi:glycosyltransferase involved in cell wall biosynthesis